jgi:hypothetical protein
MRSRNFRRPPPRLRKLLLALFLPLIAFGAVNVTQTNTVSLYKSTTKVRDYPSWSACDAAALAAAKAEAGAAKPVSSTYSCKTEVHKYVATFAADPSPVPTDTDGDGVPDAIDKCPTAAAATPDGCPIVEPPPVTKALFFDALKGSYALAQNGIRWSNVNAKRGSVTHTADGLRFRFDAVRDAWAEQRLSLPNMLDVWMRFDILIPANYFHPSPAGVSNNNKFFIAIWGGDYGDPSTPGMDINLWPKSTGESEGTVYFFPPFQHDWSAIPNAIVKADYGKWVTYTLHVYAGTPSANGGLQLWKGATKISDTRRTPYLAGQKGYDQAYLFGWANSGYSQQTDFILRNVAISDRNVFGVQ